MKLGPLACVARMEAHCGLEDSKDEDKEKHAAAAPAHYPSALPLHLKLAISAGVARMEADGELDSEDEDEDFDERAAAAAADAEEAEEEAEDEEEDEESPVRRSSGLCLSGLSGAGRPRRKRRKTSRMRRSLGSMCEAHAALCCAWSLGRDNKCLSNGAPRGGLLICLVVSCGSWKAQCLGGVAACMAEGLGLGFCARGVVRVEPESRRNVTSREWTVTST